MSTDFKGKIGEIGLYSPMFVALTFRSGLEYCNADKRVNSGDNLAADRPDVKIKNHGLGHYGAEPHCSTLPF